MAHLDHISISGFRSIAAIVKLQLQRINVIIGANGSGKSNLIGTFGFLQAVRQGQLQEYVGRAGGAAKILHFGPKVTKELKIEISFDEEVNRYAITLLPTAEDGLVVSMESTFFWNKSGYKRPYEQTLT